LPAHLARERLGFLGKEDREWLLWRTAEGFYFKK
jgi:hypothetical protein